jgi:hypothetical protein
MSGASSSRAILFFNQKTLYTNLHSFEQSNPTLTENPINRMDRRKDKAEGRMRNEETTMLFL